MARTSHGLSAGRLDRITGFLQDEYIDTGRIAGAQLLVARRGETAYSRAFGRMDLARDLAWRDDAIVRIYSMTKPIVSLALMMLWERGLFQLNDPVTKVFPEWSGQRVWVSGAGEAMQTVAPVRPVTFAHLLSHTAGLTYGGLLADIGAPPSDDPVDQVYASAAVGVRRDPTEDLESFIAKLGQVPLRYQPGEHWMYSLSTDAVGGLVQRLSGRPLDVFLREEIFEPLGMADTGFHVPDGQADRFAACYARAPDRSLRLVDDPRKSPWLAPPRFLSGGGGLVSTLADYHRFCEMLRRGGELDGARLIGPRTLDLMTRNHLLGDRDLSELAIGIFSETLPAGVGFGLGFAMVRDAVRAGTVSQGDYYWGGAATTLFWVDPREDLAVVFLTQLLPSTTYNLRGPLKNLIYAAIED